VRASAAWKLLLQTLACIGTLLAQTRADHRRLQRAQEGEAAQHCSGADRRARCVGSVLDSAVLMSLWKPQCITITPFLLLWAGLRAAGGEDGLRRPCCSVCFQAAACLSFLCMLSSDAYQPYSCWCWVLGDLSCCVLPAAVASLLAAPLPSRRQHACSKAHAHLL